MLVALSLPEGGLGIFTDRDQRSIFWGFEFRKSVFFWVLLTAAVFFGIVRKNAVFLSVSYFNSIFLGPVIIMHLVLQ